MEVDPLLTKTISSDVFLCLCSAQRTAARSRSLTEELEETRRVFKEAEERAARTQTSCTKLVLFELNSLPVKVLHVLMATFYV